MQQLIPLGWNESLTKEFAAFENKGLEAGRVAVENQDRYLVQTAHGEYHAEITGKLMFQAASPADWPKVGDWVVLSLFEEERKAIIHEILPRKSKLSRKEAGKRIEEQVLAANIDVIFIVQSLDNNFNLRRIERYLVMVYESQAQPVILLNKLDLDANFKERVNEVKRTVSNVPVMAVSAENNQGMASLKNSIKSGCTYAFIGSSGVGKSTLINKLLGADVQPTTEIRQKDGRGRHTTSRRELFVLPQGGCVIDTPGMRELQLWHSEDGVEQVFSEIEQLASQCHFSDCSHTSEIKCAVLQAVANGEIESSRYLSYVKLQKELAYLESKQNLNSQLEKKRKDKELHCMIKQVYKERKINN
ncbi:MAG: ribosome small subunit-dependent GTPase A [bacterium]